MDLQVCFAEIKIVFKQPKIIWNKTIFSRIQYSLQPSKKVKLPYATYLILIKESSYELFSKINRQIFVKTDVWSQKYSLLEKYILMELVSELLTMWWSYDREREEMIKTEKWSKFITIGGPVSECQISHLRRYFQ